MGNYSSSWTSHLPQDSPGEHEDVALSPEDDRLEAMELTVCDFPSEVWASVIAFLPFREKVNSVVIIIIIKVHCCDHE